MKPAVLTKETALMLTRLFRSLNLNYDDFVRAGLGHDDVEQFALLYQSLCFVAGESK